jgi:ABC-type nitrate/sulfonate/bicarbonate transport system ATPase subunit
MDSSRSFLQVRGIRRVFSAAADETAALSGINLDIARGSFVSIIGPSGRGKSTLPQIVAGEIESRTDHRACARLPCDRPVHGRTIQRG